MLSRFRAAKQAEIASLLAAESCGNFPLPYEGMRPAFSKALAGDRLAVIAEYKRASPSKGLIRSDLTVENVAAAYNGAGASAISILTEEKWFQGAFAFLDRAAASTSGKLPILRKDFINHPLQVRATAASRASAILLIVRYTPRANELRALMVEASRWGLECVVEVNFPEEVVIARDAGAKIIQVNARNLATLEVDRDMCLGIIDSNPPQSDELWIAASGMSNADHLRQARDAGYNAALIGTALMAHPSPGNALQNLISGLSHAD